ncbi:hypothetical protein A9Q91_02985 [Candidatus Gracilibacteria bacterium 28_42_T64]|nr:hypothetical protein A9Q91_02985 [Candidatus Gracilibacteria bacterium 28_42_T64]
MKKKHRIKIKAQIQEFSSSFVETFIKLLMSFERVQPNIREAVPDIFNIALEDIAVDSYFSENRKHVMILFKERKNKSFNFNLTKGNVFDELDETGQWKRPNIPVCFNFKGGTGFMQEITISGMKPFNIEGDKVKITFSDFKFNLPNGDNKKISFGYIFSYSLFKDEVLSNTENYVENLIYSFWDYYRLYKHKLSSSIDEKKYKKYQKGILEDMERLFFNEEIKEQEIDNFITENPIILERCLFLTPILPQQILNNLVKENFDQDMIPDLICQDINDSWIIVDYKRAKRIIKKNDTARADIKSEVNELKIQLKNYREYFNEEKHRNNFAKITGYKIPSKPKTKGLIGYVLDSERKIFEDSIEDNPNRIDIITYDELYKRFKKFYES